MKVLVIGGTGTMGKPLVDLLYSNNNIITVICRKKQYDQRNINYLYGNAFDKSFMDLALNEFYDCIIDFCLYSINDFLDRYDKLLSSTLQYVCLSSAAVYSINSGLITEDSPRLKETTSEKQIKNNDYYKYGFLKASIEDILINSGRNNWTIVRPFITYNDNRIPIGEWSEEIWITRTIHGKKVVIPKDLLKYKTTYSYGADVAMMIHSVLGKSTCLKQIYNVTSNNYVTWNEVLLACKNALSKQGYIMKIKYLEDSTPVFKHFPNMINHYKYNRMTDRCICSSKIEAEMGHIKYVNMQNQIDICVRKYLQSHNSLKTEISNDYYIKIHSFMDKYTNDKMMFNLYKGKNKYRYFRNRYKAIDTLDICLHKVYNKIRHLIIK
jgi:nucleoside-diphosphate-sugar epimerase